MKTFDRRLNSSWWALKIALGLMPIISGLDKYFNKLADWGMYLSTGEHVNLYARCWCGGNYCRNNRVKSLDKDRQLYCHGLVDCDCSKPDCHWDVL